MQLRKIIVSFVCTSVPISRSLSHTTDMTWHFENKMCYLFVLSFSPTTHATIYSVRTDFHCVTVYHCRSACEFPGTPVSAGVWSCRCVYSLKCDAVLGIKPSSQQEASGRIASIQAVLYCWKRLVVLWYPIHKYCCCPSGTELTKKFEGNMAPIYHVVSFSVAKSTYQFLMMLTT